MLNDHAISRLFSLLFTTAGLYITSLTWAASTDLATAPLVTSSSSSVRPNLMFILDDSGSMSWTHMPDTVETFAGVSGSYKYGYRSSQCNGVYYDPKITYTPPIKADGTYYPASSFANAWKNGYKTSAGTMNLGTSFYAWGNGADSTDNTISGSSLSGHDLKQAAYYYTYSGTQTSVAQKAYHDTNSIFYKECNSIIGSTAAVDGSHAVNTLFTKVLVNSTSGPGGTDETTNFANWFSYYRTRMLMMKTGAGAAFNPIGEQYRVGFMSINNNVSPAFLNISAFDSAQKSAWYTKLYASTPTGSTPVREALANSGRMYAGKLASINDAAVTDPCQYSCQQNFTILSTDGYWNGTASNVKKLDGTTTMDNQDGAEPRPRYDGSISKKVTTTVSKFEAYSTTNCTSPRRKITTTTTTTVRTLTADLNGDVVSDVSVPTVSGPVDTVSCTTAPRALQTPNPKNTVTETTTASGGSSNSLADTAQYYYRTDLRSDSLGNCNGALGSEIDVCEDNVPASGQDGAAWQHMTTFTLGLGARGRMVFSPTYLSDAIGDFFAIKSGVTANPPSICSWQTSGLCNWPTPGSDQIENIDDLWHAAINGRGTYFSATNPASLATGLANALAGVSARIGTSAAAATSSPNVTAGDNFVFSSTFMSVDWTSELVSQEIDLETGLVSATTNWSVQEHLDEKPWAERTLYRMKASGAAWQMETFTWDHLTTEEKAYFETARIASLSQFCESGTTCLTATAKTNASGQNLINFIRGDRNNEGAAEDTAKPYRQRIHVLGDIVNSEAVYVKRPLYSYADSGYGGAGGFQELMTDRDGMVYAAANDGMLHAFYAAGDLAGQERWAFIPSMVLPNLFKLADKNYANLHQFYVDGTPVAADICTTTAETCGPTDWRTVLVGGLNKGGRGYYALDITDPAAPTALWEFAHDNLGYTYGNPLVTKLKDGTWVVIVSSGYNNTTPGDGKGYLFILNAVTGALIRTISTDVGTADAPSGLARITAWSDNANVDNTATRVYGGDLLGNLWRFDINGDVGADGFEAHRLATLRDLEGNVQPITTKPEIGEIASNAVVYVGTGRFLGVTDLSDTGKQSFYAIKDTLGASTYDNPRTLSSFVQQTFSDGQCPTGTASTICVSGETIRTNDTKNVVNFSADNGWFVDLPGTGERSNTDPILVFNTLLFNTNLPNLSACTLGGYSFRYFLDARTGGYVATVGTKVAAVKLGNALATRPVVVSLPNKSLISVTRLSGGSTVTHHVPIDPVAQGTRRVSWRELGNGVE